MYDKVERHTNCTVEILTDSKTGQVSVGWWDNDNPPVKIIAQEEPADDLKE